MRELDQSVASSGIAVRCITIGLQEKADEFCGRHNATARCIGDEDKRTYAAMGLEDFDLSQLKTDLALVKRRDENEAAGFRQDWDATRLEDAAQLPGAAAIDSAGTLRLIYRGRHPGDLPPMSEIFAQARMALALT